MFAISNKPPDPELPTFRLGHYWYQIRSKPVNFNYGIYYETGWDAWQPMSFTDEEHAQEFLHELFRSSENADEVRQFILYHDPEKIVDTTFGFTDDDHLIEIIAAGIMRGDLSLHRFHKVPFVYPYPDSEYLKPPAPWIPPSTWIEIQVVFDDTGEPVTNLPIMLQDSQTQGKMYQTDGNGMIRVKPVEPGACEVRCSFQGIASKDCVVLVGSGEDGTASQAEGDGEVSPRTQFKPKAIVCVKERKVKSGENIERIACEEGVKPADLAFFNFGTNDPDEVNQCMADQVGCTKTDEKGDYVFDDSDVPGMLFVPQQWKLGGLGTSQKHVLRVAPVSEPPIAFDVALVDENGAPVSNISLCLMSSCGSKWDGNTGDSGSVRWRPLNSLAHKLEWKETDDEA